MKRSTVRYKFPTCGFLLLALSAAGAQVASHTPTVFTKAPASSPAVQSAAASKPVARVNGTVLTDADLVREEYAIFPYARQHNGVPKELEAGIRSGALKMIVFEELVHQEAQRRKLSVPAAQMQRAELDFRKQFATPEEFNTLLRDEFHGSQQLLRDKIRRSLLIEALLKSEIDDKAAVSSAELRAYYDKNPAQFRRPETFTFQTISVLPPANADAVHAQEGRKRAEDALRQAKAAKTNEAFGLLAEKISDDDYRVMMGQHKPVTAAELAPQVLKALLAMKPGDVSEVIQIDEAFTIVRLNEHALSRTLKFDDVKSQLEKDLQQRKTNDLRAALDKKLRQNAKIEEM